MLFGLLGPLELWPRGGVQVVSSARQRGVLAVLLTRANRVVGLDALIEEVWNGRPPATARSAIHVHLSGVRRLLATAGAPALCTRPSGYVLSVADGELDVECFNRLVDRGRAALAAGRPDTAADILATALRMWRGPALANVPVVSLQAEVVPGWEEARLGALEDRLDADLRCGRHRQVVAELRGLVAAHPARERLHGQLMLALYRSGRQTEALAWYRDTRRLLVEEIGVEPGPELRGLHHAILTSGPGALMAGIELPAHGRSLAGANKAAPKRHQRACP